MFERRYFVYMLQSSSRRALYIGFTNFLIVRNIEHRTRKYPRNFTAKYRAWRLVYYEEYGDAEAAKDRERQLKGWSRSKKNALVVKLNPKWRDLVSEWEEKYGLEFRLDGRITLKESQKPPQDPSTPVSRAGENARVPPPLRIAYAGVEGRGLLRRLPQSQKQPQDPSTPVSAPQERKPRSWGPRISRARPTERERAAQQGPGNALVPPPLRIG